MRSHTTTDWLLSNCQRTTMIKMEHTLNLSGKIEASEKPAASTVTITTTVSIRTDEASKSGEMKVRKRKGDNNRTKKLLQFILFIIQMEKR